MKHNPLRKIRNIFQQFISKEIVNDVINKGQFIAVGQIISGSMVDFTNINRIILY